MISSGLLYIIYGDSWRDLGTHHQHQEAPANSQTSTRRWAVAGLMLGQRRRRWPNISPAAAQCLVLAGRGRSLKGAVMLGQRRRLRPNITTTLGWCVFAGESRYGGRGHGKPHTSKVWTVDCKIRFIGGIMIIINHVNVFQHSVLHPKDLKTWRKKSWWCGNVGVLLLIPRKFLLILTNLVDRGKS